MELGILHFLLISFSYTKMGYAGNIEPSYLIPTVIADSLVKVIKLLNLFRLLTRQQHLL